MASNPTGLFVAAVAFASFTLRRRQSTAPRYSCDDGSSDCECHAASSKRRPPPVPLALGSRGVTVEAGAKLYFCTCGLSKNYPLCVVGWVVVVAEGWWLWGLVTHPPPTHTQPFGIARVTTNFAVWGYSTAAVFAGGHRVLTPLCAALPCPVSPNLPVSPSHRCDGSHRAANAANGTDFAPSVWTNDTDAAVEKRVCQCGHTKNTAGGGVFCDGSHRKVHPTA